MSNFLDFLSTNVSISVIAGIFTFRLISAVLENIINPLINIILDENTFYSYNMTIDQDDKVVLTDPVNNLNHTKYYFGFGVVIRELIIWIIAMFILYYINLFTKN